MMEKGTTYDLNTLAGPVSGEFESTNSIAWWVFRVPNNSSGTETHPVYVNPLHVITAIPKGRR